MLISTVFIYKYIAEKYIESEPQIAEVAVNPDETNSSSIRGMSNEDSTLTEGTITYDIRFMASAPVSGELIRLIINIEAQNDFYPGYPLIKRGIYYCSRMISAQYGTEFNKSHYENIKKVYSIWICTNPPKSKKSTITSYSFAEKNLVGNVKEKIENYDLMTSVMICLGEADDKNNDGILRLLEVLLLSETQPEGKKRILQDEGITGTSTKHREGFKRMIADALAGKIDLIITKSVSRFARNTVDSLTAIRQLKENGTECYFEKKDFYTARGCSKIAL